MYDSFIPIFALFKVLKYDFIITYFGNSLDQLRHPRSYAYSAEQQIWGGGACLDCYPYFSHIEA